MTDLSQIDTNTLLTLYKKAQAVQPKGVGPAAAQKMTEGQAKDGFNAKRMVGAEANLMQVENSPGFDPTLAGVISPIGGKRSRIYRQGQNEWSDSLIRLTTGAAATKQEIEQANQTYFPQFGDPPEVVRQKAEARKRVEQDALSRAGPGAAGAMLPGTRKAGWSPLKSSVAAEQAKKGGVARVGRPAASPLATMSDDELKAALGL